MIDHQAAPSGWAADLLERPFLLGGLGVLLLLLSGALPIAVGTALGVTNFSDVGYPDSATLLTIREFLKTGHIYSDINQPPYQVSIYGPLFYFLLAIPYALAERLGISPQVSVRIYEIGSLVICLLSIFLISKRLYGSRPTAWLSLLFAVSALPFARWTTQVRPDLPGLGFSLLSICLCLSIETWPFTVGSAILAGCSFLIKPTFVAAPVAVLGWFVFRRQFKSAVLWAAVFALTVIGAYTVTWWREPFLFEHINAVRHPVFEFTQGIGFIFEAGSQPVVPFAAFGGFLAFWRPTHPRFLVLIYCLVAWLVAIASIPQAGVISTIFGSRCWRRRY